MLLLALLIRLILLILKLKCLLLLLGCEFLLTAALKLLLKLGLCLSLIDMREENLFDIQFKSFLEQVSVILMIEGLLRVERDKVFS